LALWCSFRLVFAVCLSRLVEVELNSSIFRCHGTSVWERAHELFVSQEKLTLCRFTSFCYHVMLARFQARGLVRAAGRGCNCCCTGMPAPTELSLTFSSRALLRRSRLTAPLQFLISLIAYTSVPSSFSTQLMLARCGACGKAFLYATCHVHVLRTHCRRTQLGGSNCVFCNLEDFASLSAQSSSLVRAIFFYVVIL
jgi:hypothetical protein